MAARILVLLLLTASAPSCKSTSKNDMVDRPSLAVPSGTGGGPLSAASVLNIFAAARCEREVSCGMLGENRSTADRAGCERDALRAHADDVQLIDCPTGLSAAKVQACADNLRSVSCNL